MAFCGEELTSALRPITAQGGSEVRSCGHSTAFCAVHSSLFCGPQHWWHLFWDNAVSIDQLHPACSSQSCALAGHWDPVPKRFWSRSINSFSSALPTPPGLGLVLCFSHPREGGMSLLTAAAPKRNISKYPCAKDLFSCPGGALGLCRVRKGLWSQAWLVAQTLLTCSELASLVCTWSLYHFWGHGEATGPSRGT